MPRAPTHILDVKGEFACFSRPELKVERFSYPLPTPSAARGIFDAIFFKFDETSKKARFYWQVDRIEMLTWPSYIALRRNEVKDKVNLASAANWMKGKGEAVPLFADADKESTGTDTKGRTQRQTMALRDVRYRLHAHIVPRSGCENQQTALDEQFRRRAAAGKCFHQPYFGCREFIAFFRLVENVAQEPPRVDFSQDLGWMLYDVFDLSAQNDSFAAPSISVFQAQVQNGLLTVPPHEDERVRKPQNMKGRAEQCSTSL
jgi:CRISPR-associated protein Cas5d